MSKAIEIKIGNRISFKAVHFGIVVSMVGPGPTIQWDNGGVSQCSIVLDDLRIVDTLSEPVKPPFQPTLF